MSPEESKPLARVRVRHGAKGLCYSNILFARAYPMRGGKFPADHPCSANPVPTVFGRGEQPSTTDALGLLRARGYLASCFPEGDGIAFAPPDGHTTTQVEADIRECFPAFVVVPEAPR